MRFEDLRLSEPLLRAVRAAGYRAPTPIQSNAIPIVLAGRDVLGCAQTGTGKTAAFALPILQRLIARAALAAGAARNRTALGNGSANKRPTRPAERRGRARSLQRPDGAVPADRIRVLVLCPTRELAQQIHESFATYGLHTGIRTAAVFGGVNQNPQVRAIRAGADVVIATPGRPLDLLGQGLLSLAGVEILVLDEADRMLDIGFSARHPPDSGPDAAAASVAALLGHDAASDSGARQRHSPKPGPGPGGARLVACRNGGAPRLSRRAAAESVAAGTPARPRSAHSRPDIHANKARRRPAHSHKRPCPRDLRL